MSKEDVIKLIVSSRKVVCICGAPILFHVLPLNINYSAGAGISVAAGIPVFRGEKGLWKNGFDTTIPSISKETLSISALSVSLCQTFVRRMLIRNSPNISGCFRIRDAPEMGGMGCKEIERCKTHGISSVSVLLR